MLIYCPKPAIPFSILPCPFAHALTNLRDAWMRLGERRQWSGRTIVVEARLILAAQTDPSLSRLGVRLARSAARLNDNSLPAVCGIEPLKRTNLRVEIG